MSLQRRSCLADSPRRLASMGYHAPGGGWNLTATALCGVAFFLGQFLTHGQARETLTARSLSGQFTVNDARTMPSPAALGRFVATNASFIRLEPALVSISCERIKQLLNRELEAPDAWRGKVFLVLYAAQSTNDNVLISSERFGRGWQYRVALPDILTRTRYVTALTQILLLEMANRDAGDRSAELPPWLVQGFSRQLLASSEQEIILPPPGRSAAVAGPLPAAVVVGKKENPLKEAHRVLSTHSPLSFEELSWPDEHSLTGEAGEAFVCSSQVFVDGLLRLKDGKASMRQMLASLPQFYNWQLAFLRAYQACFQRPLDVEKWWAVRLTHFSGRQLVAETWSADDSWGKLDEIIRSAVLMSNSASNSLPEYKEVTLQNIVRDYERESQTQALQEKLAQLQVLRLRLATNALPLLDQYRFTLEKFLQDRDKTGLPIPFRREAVRRKVVEETVKELDSLDSRRPISRSLVKASARE
jgi:hypothetical protein